MRTPRALGIPAITDAFHHTLNPVGLTLEESLDISLPTWGPRDLRPRLHLSGKDSVKQPGTHAYYVERQVWDVLVSTLDCRVADVMVGAKDKERADGRRDRVTSGRTSPRRKDMHQNPDSREIRDLLRRANTVAVVGLSDRPYRTSHAIAGALQRFGYKIIPVNPNLTGPVLGEEPYASLEDIPTAVDIVDVFRRSEKVMPVAEAAVASGAKVLWMQTGVVNEEAAAYAREHDLTVVMDRCIKVDYATLVGAEGSRAVSPPRQGE